MSPSYRGTLKLRQGKTDFNASLSYISGLTQNKQISNTGPKKERKQKSAVKEERKRIAPQC